MSQKRKSNAELERTGSHLHDDEQPIALGQPDVPGDLSERESAIWQETTQLLFDAGRLTRLDGGALRAYCRAASEWEDSYADLQKSGYYVKAGTGALKLSPQLQRFNLCDRALQRWCSELGLSPKSRPAAVVELPSTTPSLEDILDGDGTAGSANNRIQNNSGDSQ
jgi:P27 family predicted phage terminase small subunit